jgi:hypothetical protein
MVPGEIHFSMAGKNYDGIFHGRIIPKTKFPFNFPTIELNSTVFGHFKLPFTMLQNWIPDHGPYELLDYIYE